MPEVSELKRAMVVALNTGLEVQVPEYGEPGDIIKINTATAKFISRA